MLARGTLDFEAPDMEAFPCLKLAMQAAEAGEGAPVVLNAANEVAVAAFLDERLPFTGIARSSRRPSIQCRVRAVPASRMSWPWIAAPVRRWMPA